MVQIPRPGQKEHVSAKPQGLPGGMLALGIDGCIKNSYSDSFYLSGRQVNNASEVAQIQ